MPVSFETRLTRLEASHAPAQRSHEDWLALLDGPSTMTDAEADAEAIAEYGSLAAAAEVARARATRSGDFMDDLIAESMEQRARL